MKTWRKKEEGKNKGIGRRKGREDTVGMQRKKEESERGMQRRRERREEKRRTGAAGFAVTSVCMISIKMIS